jgi:hypothetical protein
MKNEMMKNEMTLAGTQLLRLPLQAAPVERKLGATPHLSGQVGVVSAGWREIFESTLPRVLDGPTIVHPFF